LKCQSRVNQGH